MTTKLSNLEDLLVEELKDLYSAETQLLKALPKMAKSASDEQLRAGFQEHLEETQQHVERLEKIMDILGATPRGKTCKAMKGLIEEGQDMMKEDAEPAVKDAALIAAAQKVEHYEIAGYGTARTFAELIGQDDVAELLTATLEEEKATDEKLTEVARTINVEAEEGGSTEEEA
jgi:ferritin-like metal-binding protein YciE